MAGGGLLVGTKPYAHLAPVGDRSEAERSLETDEIDPRLSDEREPLEIADDVPYAHDHEGTTKGKDGPTRSRLRLQHDDMAASLHEVERGREAGEPGAHDDDGLGR